MKRFFFIIILWITTINALCAQGRKLSMSCKPILDTSQLGKWPQLGGTEISPSGKYLSFDIQTPASGNRICVIRDSSGLWQRQYTNISDLYFSKDERFVLFQQNDSLHFLKLGQHDTDRVIVVRSYQHPIKNSGKWIAYTEKSSENTILMNLLTNKQQDLGKVSVLGFRKNEDGLFLKKTYLKDDLNFVELIYLELSSLNEQSVWKGTNGESISNLSFDKKEQEVTFLTTKKSGNKKLRSLWYYSIGIDKAIERIQDDDAKMPSGYELSDFVGFSGNGKWLFFNLLRCKAPQDTVADHKATLAKVNVWSYRDREMPSFPTEKVAEFRERLELATVSATGNIFRRLPGRLYISPEQIPGNLIVLLEDDSTRCADSRHNFSYPSSTYLFEPVSGKKKLITKDKTEKFYFSPDNQWFIYFDKNKGSFISYNIRLGKSYNLTAKLPVSVLSDYTEDLQKTAVDHIIGWVKEKKCLLLYDNYDIWRIDPFNKQAAVNITRGYGLAHHIKLRSINQEPRIYSVGDTILLTGFNINNKYNGFFRQIIDSKNGPQLLYMGPYLFYRTISQVPPAGEELNSGMVPQKASIGNFWIVKRQSAIDAPNYFFTKDLKLFKPLTNLEPQSKYNWLITELINYKQSDGTNGQGVLYKPENFDPSKKYPVIFNYYQWFSQRIYEFPTPNWMTDNINIPWFVSHGYLVFTPDMRFGNASLTNKTVGKSALNSIVGAVNYLSKLSYVDKKRMALQGHSFGAMETNYLVTHSHAFAAAAEMSGVTDAVSEYLSLLPTDENSRDTRDNQNLWIYEVDQVRIGATLWKRPDLYFDLSSVLRANYVTTPLLITHQRRDGAVNWQQGVEFYMALRRLEKPSWMLQYDQENHSLGINSAAAKDYTIRLTQFFDHYLKGQPPPEWMTRGIPDSLKGIKSGYDLDPDGSCSPNCPICSKQDYRTYYKLIQTQKE